jgi:hypothetical protein
MKNKFMELSKSDLVKSAIMAGGSVIATAMIVVLQGLTAIPPVYPTLHSLVLIVTSGVVAGGVYILKNLFTNSNDELLKADK